MKTFKRFVAFGLTLSIIMCSTAASTFASESTQGRASNSTEVHDFLVSGLAAAEAVSEFEDTTKTKFSVEDFSNLNITDDWETGCGKNSPKKWCRSMTERLSIKLFGAKAIENDKIGVK